MTDSQPMPPQPLAQAPPFNGLYDSGDNLIGLLDGITTVPSRLIRLPAA